MWNYPANTNAIIRCLHLAQSKISNDHLAICQSGVRCYYLNPLPYSGTALRAEGLQCCARIETVSSSRNAYRGSADRDTRQMTRHLHVILLFALLAPSSAIADLLASPPPGDRVVCVSKQINEFVFDIGRRESHLVARDLTSIYPPEILKLPSVGYHRALSPEGIISMRPSVLLTDGNVGPDEVLDRVRSVGISVVTMDPGDTIRVLRT